MRETKEMESEFYHCLCTSEFILTFQITTVNLLKILIAIWLPLSHKGIPFPNGYLNTFRLSAFLVGSKGVRRTMKCEFPTHFKIKRHVSGKESFYAKNKSEVLNR